MKNSKKILLVLVCFLASFFVNIGKAETNNVTMTWDWADTNLEGYVYVGNLSRVYYTNYYVGTNLWETYIPAGKTLYFAVTAVNKFGDQSEFSNELVVQRVRPVKPVLNKYTIYVK